MKYETSINTIRPNHHIWSISKEGQIGVFREGVAKSLSGAMSAIRDSKKRRPWGE